MQQLSVFAAVASRVVVSLASRYKKAHFHEKQKIVMIFLFLQDELWLMKKKGKKKNKMDILSGLLN